MRKADAAKLAKGRAILAALREAGTVYVSEHGEYVGLARDGQEVNLGSVGFEDGMFSYLVEYPTPDRW